MNPKLRKALLVALTLVFVVSLGGFISSLLDYRKGDQVNAEADALVELPDFTDIQLPETPEQPEAGQEPAEPYIDPYADALAAMDFAALRQVNSEVLGWIIIPDTSISYPLLQHNNNQYYLGHNWKGGSSRVGSIFLETTNSRGLSDFNTIIYGHRMNNGSMFTPLQKFQKQDFWANHPSVYITTDAGSFRYDIFAAYEVSTEGLTYALGFSSDKAKQRFIDFCLEQSVIDTGLVPQVHDYILTLSTCTGHGHATRWVVQAVRRGEAPEEPENPDTSAAPETNPNNNPENNSYNTSDNQQQENLQQDNTQDVLANNNDTNNASGNDPEVPDNTEQNNSEPDKTPVNDDEPEAPPTNDADKPENNLAEPTGTPNPEDNDQPPPTGGNN